MSAQRKLLPDPFRDRPQESYFLESVSGLERPVYRSTQRSNTDNAAFDSLGKESKDACNFGLNVLDAFTQPKLTQITSAPVFDELPPSVPGNYLEPSYHFYTNTKAPLLLHALLPALEKHHVDCKHLKNKFKIKCTSYSAGERVMFYVSIFLSPSCPTPPPGTFVVEFQRRTGCVMHFSRLFHLVQQDMIQKSYVVRGGASCGDDITVSPSSILSSAPLPQQSLSLPPPLPLSLTFSLTPSSSSSSSSSSSPSASSSASEETLLDTKLQQLLEQEAKAGVSSEQAQSTVHNLVNMMRSPYVDVMLHALEALSELTRESVMASAMFSLKADVLLLPIVQNMNVEDVRRCAITVLANLTERAAESKENDKLSLCAKLLEAKEVLSTLISLRASTETQRITQDVQRLATNLAATVSKEAMASNELWRQLMCYDSASLLLNTTATSSALSDKLELQLPPTTLQRTQYRTPSPPSTTATNLTTKDLYVQSSLMTQSSPLALRH